VFFCINPLEFEIGRWSGTFAGQWMLVLLGLGLFFLALDLKRHMLISLAGSAFLAFFLKTASNTNLVFPGETNLPKVTVAHVNLSSIAGDFDDLMAMVEDIDVDVISFQEFTPLWDKKLKDRLKGKYKHQKSMVRIDFFGMALYSKYPFVQQEIFNYNEKPNLLVGLNAKGMRFYLLSSYVLPPINRKTSEEAKGHLQKISDRINQISHPIISLGEFNMVYWSNEIRYFREAAQLQNSRRATSLNSLEVDYDHIFYSKDFECVFFEELRGKDQKRLGIVGTYQIKTDLSSD